MEEEIAQKVAKKKLKRDMVTTWWLFWGFLLVFNLILLLAQWGLKTL